MVHSELFHLPGEETILILTAGTMHRYLASSMSTIVLQYNSEDISWTVVLLAGDAMFARK